MPRRHGDPRVSQKHADPERNVSQFLGRFIMTFVVLLCVAFGLAYLIGLGVLNMGGILTTLAVVFVLALLLVLITANSLSGTR